MAPRSAIAFLIGLTLGLVYWGLPSAAQEPPGICDLLPGAEICNGGGTDPGGGGGAEEEPSSYAWGAVEPLLSSCADDPPRPQYLQRLVWGSGPNAGEYVTLGDFDLILGPRDPVPGGPPGAVFAADGFAYRWVCSSLDIAADIWAQAQRFMDPVTVDKNPSVSGLTGLETWAWYDGDPTVQPFQLVWTDPSTGFSWTLEAWAWMGNMTWEFGDGDVHVESAGDLAEAASVSGTEYQPAATHTYRTTSADAGYTGGYPFSFAATWVGEYRWSGDGGGSWSGTAPMSGSYTDSAAIAYEVLQVRSALVADGG